MNSVSASERDCFFEGTNDVRDDVVAVVVSFIVGDELVAEVGLVITGDHWV